MLLMNVPAPELLPSLILYYNIYLSCTKYIGKNSESLACVLCYNLFDIYQFSCFKIANYMWKVSYVLGNYCKSMFMNARLTHRLSEMIELLRLNNWKFIKWINKLLSFFFLIKLLLNAGRAGRMNKLIFISNILKMSTVCAWCANTVDHFILYSIDWSIIQKSVANNPSIISEWINFNSPKFIQYIQSVSSPCSSDNFSIVYTICVIWSLLGHVLVSYLFILINPIKNI